NITVETYTRNSPDSLSLRLTQTPPQLPPSTSPAIATMQGENLIKPHQQQPKLVVLADLNDDPPEFDEDDANDAALAPAAAVTAAVAPVPVSVTPRVNNDEGTHERAGLIFKETNDSVDVEGKRTSKSGKCRSKSNKLDDLDCGADADGDPYSQGVSSAREEKISSLKTGLIHVARKLPKNAHAHYLLGLIYQRLAQPQKASPLNFFPHAIQAYEKAEEILLRSDEEIDRPELLSLVQIHHAQCVLLESLGDSTSEKELEPEELEEIISKLEESMQSDIRQAAVWNTLGVTFLKTGRLQSAISVFSSLLTMAPDNLDCLGNLGLAQLQSGFWYVIDALANDQNDLGAIADQLARPIQDSNQAFREQLRALIKSKWNIGNLDAALNCFQELILKDQGHPSSLINYAAILLCRYGSVVSGAGANSAEGAASDASRAANVAKECLLAAIKADPRSSHAWANLANAYDIMGDHWSSGKCLEKAAKLDPSCMSTRYAAAIHRIKESERSQSPSEQLPWAGNEMASVLKEGDPLLIEMPIAWAGFAMVHKSQHEIASAFDTSQNELIETQERAVYSLKQAIGEDSDDAMHWHQLGLHSLHTQQFQASQRYLKAAIARFKECSYTWSNLGIALQLGEETAQAEEVFQRALSLATPEQSHAIFSNLGNLYRQQGKYDRAKAMFTKSLKIRPGYAPAYNNLGLVFIAEGLLEEAKFCFEKALAADPLLDAAKSNLVKVSVLTRELSWLMFDTFHISSEADEHYFYLEESSEQHQRKASSGVRNLVHRQGNQCMVNDLLQILALGVQFLRSGVVNCVAKSRSMWICGGWSWKSRHRLHVVYGYKLLMFSCERFALDYMTTLP
ncbi:putative UDP-N-acetylglucosamine--peptide N-acetylglucosaminyltransferase SPINDLY, partial [Drosera capensis]